jgi:hypothetical protein
MMMNLFYGQMLSEKLFPPGKAKPRRNKKKNCLTESKPGKIGLSKNPNSSSRNRMKGSSAYNRGL